MSYTFQWHRIVTAKRSIAAPWGGGASHSHFMAMIALQGRGQYVVLETRRRSKNQSGHREFWSREDFSFDLRAFVGDRLAEVIFRLETDQK